MKLIYNLGIYIFYLLVRIASVKNEKARKWLYGRKNQFKAIENSISKTDRPVWLHCASLGEFEQGRPLIGAIKKRYPDKKILLTFYSPSGYEVMKDSNEADFIFYLPLDSYRNAKRFVALTNPELVFFIKYEYWYNFLRVLKKNNIPTYFVSAIFRSDQLFFKWYGGWYRRMLYMAKHFFVQNQKSAHLLESLGINNHTVSGDTRFDRVFDITSNVKPLQIVEGFVNGEKVIVAGSSWKSEEALLRQYLRNNPTVKAIVVPHEIGNGNVQRIADQFGDAAVIYTEVGNAQIDKKQVLIVDCYGILPSIYQYGKVAIVGGGFGVGIHNLLEPATYGMPIIIGPNYQRFKEACDLVEMNCAFPVNNVEEFNTVLNHLLKNPQTADKISALTAGYVKSNLGATKKIINAVF
jgi:3-deoxy-D-manno-octulosonic-acid transferase